MRAKILLSVVALGAIGLAALPGDLIRKPADRPVALSADGATTQDAATPGAISATAPAAPQAAAMPQNVALAQPATTSTPPASAFPPGQETATVGGSALNVRQGPASSYERLFVVQAGEQLAVLDKSGAWVQIRRPTGESGWVHSRYLAGGAAADRPQAATAPPPQASIPDQAPDLGARRYVRLGMPSLIFASPSRSAQPLFRVAAGERLRISDYRGNWLRVTTSDGISGWLRVR